LIVVDFAFQTPSIYVFVPKFSFPFLPLPMMMMMMMMLMLMMMLMMVAKQTLFTVLLHKSSSKN
jgi:hypothetical protein